MSNNTQEKEKTHIAQQIETIFHVDVRMDNLKQFLQNVAQVINQQQMSINQLQADLKTKVTSERVEQAFKQISKSIELNDPELHKKVATLLEKPKPENTGDAIMDSSSMVCNKIVYLGQACSLIYKGNKDWEKKLSTVEAELPKKVGIDVVKDQISKTKNKIMNDFEQFKIQSQKQIDDQGKKFQYEVGRFEQLVKDSEKKTIWKINDCEALLQKRVTSDYVDNTAKSLEDRLKREILKMKEESFSDIQHQINLLNDKLKNFDDNQSDKQKALKKQIKDLEDLFSLKFCSNDKYETNKKAVSDKLQELDNKIALVDRKGNANEVNDALIKALKDLDEKLYALQREDNHLKTQIQDLQVKIELQGKAIEKGENVEEGNISDPHRICALESELKRLRDDLVEHKRIISNLDFELRRKFEALEHKVLGQFNNIKKQEQGTLSREEIIQMIERGKIFAEEKFKVIEGDIIDMKGKVGLINDLDKKLKKKFRELQDNTDWSKKLDEKANNEETKKEFLHVDEKIKNINALVNQFRKEFEAIEEFYLQLATLLKNNQQETISLITGNTRIIPNRCVACGTKGRQNVNTSDVRGTDGKIYKADFGSQHQTSVYEQQEVFDVLPQEVGLPNIYVSDEKVNKYGVQFKGRPNSAKTDIQSVNNNLQSSFVSNRSGRKF